MKLLCPDQAGRSTEAAPAPGREKARLLGAYLAEWRAGVEGGPLFLLAFALCMANTQGQVLVLPLFC